ncbi:hypothetical protein ACLOJK_036989 [Asimina triloba]
MVVLRKDFAASVDIVITWQFKASVEMVVPRKVLVASVGIVVPRQFKASTKMTIPRKGLVASTRIVVPQQFKALIGMVVPRTRSYKTSRRHIELLKLDVQHKYCVGCEGRDMGIGNVTRSVKKQGVVPHPHPRGG